MQAEKLVLTKSNKMKGCGGDYWYSRPGSTRYIQEEMLKLVREGREIEFHNGKEEKELLALLCLADKGSNREIDFNRTGDTSLLNRIIRAGGFIAYIEKLEFEIIGNEIEKDALNNLHIGD